MSNINPEIENALKTLTNRLSYCHDLDSINQAFAQFPQTIYLGENEIASYFPMIDGCLRQILACKYPLTKPDRKKMYNQVFQTFTHTLDLRALLMYDNAKVLPTLPKGTFSTVRNFFFDIVSQVDADAIGLWSLHNGYSWINPIDLVALNTTYANHSYERKEIAYHVFSKELSYYKHLSKLITKAAYLEEQHLEVPFEVPNLQSYVPSIQKTLSTLKSVMKQEVSPRFTRLFFEYSNFLIDIIELPTDALIEKNGKILSYFAKIAMKEIAASNKIKLKTFTQLRRCMKRLNDEKLFVQFLMYDLCANRSNQAQFKTLSADDLIKVISALLADNQFEAARFELDIFQNVSKADVTTEAVKQLYRFTAEPWYSQTKPAVNRQSLSPYANAFVNYLKSL